MNKVLKFPKEKVHGLFVWWLDNDEAEVLSYMKGILPEYIISELGSMSGRPLRGRLWVHKSIDFKKLPDEAIPRMEGTFDKLGGLVFKADDLEIVSMFPGIITDPNLSICVRVDEDDL